MTETAIILAAGRGSRLDPAGATEGFAKPLVAIAGRTLLRRSIDACRAVGIRRIVVVTGFNAGAVAAEAGDATCVHNPAWHRGNGLSLLAARDAARGPFALLMADHVFAPSILRDLCAVGPGDGARLAVDARRDAVLDLDDATKVARDGGGAIRRIGKHLDAYDAIDCGLFACTPAVFDALEAARHGGDCSISDGMQRLADRGALASMEIGGRFWMDVDTPAELAAAARVIDTSPGAS